jgi:hypothetical protein
MEEYWSRSDAMEEQKEEEVEGEGEEEGGDTLEPKEEERRGAKRSAKDRLGTRRIKLDRQKIYFFHLGFAAVKIGIRIQHFYHDVVPDPDNAFAVTLFCFT